MLKHNVPSHMIEVIDYLQEFDGDAGWMIYLKDGYTFDPMANDGSRWIPENCAEEAMQLVAYTI